ncbi:tRNA (adenosine(37)-N6)-threonylcarbamoyltransferase complex dimerization subunit type 1 TsaB [Candidatus Fermentibacteria bacterium]|nr:MAG: tRNA (adenosine(37)-N6)-threonylcarbamoyltransferase complex dimerization subunit type 1 TsaB [Candidatus Fermentibacteria bacterium]
MSAIWLGIDTTSATGGVALVDGETILAESVLPVDTFHSEKLLPAVSETLDKVGLGGDELAGIGVSAGPGSYTGIRIGASTAMGLGSGWNVPLRGVSALRIIASQLPEGEPVLSCIRARQGEVFAAVFQSSSIDSKEILESGIYRVEKLKDHIPKGCCAVGSGRKEVQEVMAGRLKWVSPLLDTPRPSLAAWCACKSAEKEGFQKTLEPLYLREFNQRLD